MSHDSIPLTQTVRIGEEEPSSLPSSPVLVYESPVAAAQNTGKVRDDGNQIDGKVLQMEIVDTEAEDSDDSSESGAESNDQSDNNGHQLV